MKIIGLRIEKYIGEQVSGHNGDFEYESEEMEKHILCGITSDCKKVEITLSTVYGECGSGWATASWGHMEVNEVSRFSGYTHTPLKNLQIEEFDQESGDIENEVFEVSYDGDDPYYPTGYYHVYMELFKKTPRHKDKRPIWVFKGNSNLGKSFIASKLNDLSVYETDVNDELPEIITHDVIVLGNKYTYDLDEVRNNIFGDYELILVGFETLH